MSRLSPLPKLLLAALLVSSSALALAQASAIPSAAPGGDAPLETNKGRKLLAEMIQALGGDAWTNRVNWKFQGRTATFYKGVPHQDAPAFEEYFRAKPFAERVILISHYGTFIATDHSDIAEVWNKDGGFEITYKGRKDLPAKDVADYMRRRAHSLDVLVGEWLQDPNVVITYEGAGMVERRLSEQVSILSPSNDAVTLQLDEDTHLPLSLSYQWRDPLYKDLNTDAQQFADYHTVQGIATPYSVTNLHNGEMTSQRFLTKVAYNLNLPDDLFNPDRPLSKKAK